MKKTNPNRGINGTAIENINTIANIAFEKAMWYPRSKYQSSSSSAVGM